VSVKEQPILYDSASVGLSQNVTAKIVTALLLFVRLLYKFHISLNCETLILARFLRGFSLLYPIAGITVILR
jgi:hypothetical protein